MEPLLPGLVPAPAVLLDELARPDLRDVFGALAARSARISTAIRRARLSGVDLTGLDLGRLDELRVLVAEINAIQLDAEALANLAKRNEPR